MKQLGNKKMEFLTFLRSHFDFNQGSFQEAKASILNSLPYWLAGILTAVIATLYAKAFGIIEKDAILIVQNFNYWSFLIVPTLFLLSWLLVELVAPFSNGSGIPQLMAAAELSRHESEHGFIQKLLGVKVLIIKILSSLVAVLGGGSIGREGPTLQIAGCVFYLVGKIFPSDLRIKNSHGLILAGGAAGLASAFNTPLGGIAYVVEELSKSHLSTFRTGVLQAVIVAGLISQLIMGPYLYLGYPSVDKFNLNQILIVILISILVSIFISIFSGTLKKIVKVRAVVKSLYMKGLFAILVGVLFVGIAMFGTHTILGSGKEILNEMLFHSKIAEFSDVMARFFGSVLTYSAGGAGGIFAPTLSIGGATSSYLLNLIGENLGPMGVLVGMTAALSALTQSPFTSFVIILEMTDRHSAIFPLMIAALIGQGVSKLLSGESFYEFVCERILKLHHTTEEKA